MENWSAWAWLLYIVIACIVGVGVYLGGWKLIEAIEDYQDRKWYREYHKKELEIEEGSRQLERFEREGRYDQCPNK